jgi:hypothetical protein
MRGKIMDFPAEKGKIMRGKIMKSPQRHSAEELPRHKCSEPQAANLVSGTATTEIFR